MNAPVRESRLNRASVFFGILASIATAGAGLATVLAVSFNGQAQQSQDEAGDLRGEVQSLTEERDQLSAEVAELKSGAEPPTEEPPGVDSDFLRLDDASGSERCTNDYFNGDWHTDTIRFQGQQYLHAFSCVPYLVSDPSVALPIGYVDFLVADGAERLVGLAGIDENSGDTTLIAEFTVQTVPESADPLFSQVLSFGEFAEFDVDVSGTTRVRFEIEVLDSDYTYQYKPEHIANASWAEVRFS